MPLYDYGCDTCGPFRDWQPMSLWDLDIGCPSCGRPSKRLVAKPSLSCIDRDVRHAHERNERSAEEPHVMRREEWRAANGGVGMPTHQRAHGHHGRNIHRRSMIGHAH